MEGACAGQQRLTRSVRVQTGGVSQDAQEFLTEEQVAKNYILTCVAYPTSDIVITSGVESELASE